MNGDGGKRIGIVVVAYNAASTLARVLDRIPDEFVGRISGILVCDNHSEDKTYLVGLGYKQASQRLPLTVVRHDRNLGYGGNQKAGYRWAIEQGFDIAVLLHADGQYAPELLPEMVAPLERGEADAVFGSRMMVPRDALRGGMPLYKYVGNKILSSFENRVVGTHLSEWHSGYRAYSVDALCDIDFEANSDEYDFDTGIILQLHEAGKRIVEIPIPTFYGDEISYVNGMRYAKDIVRDVLRYRTEQVSVRAADDVGERLAAWASSRAEGRVLVMAEPPTLLVVEAELRERSLDVSVVDLAAAADAQMAIEELAGSPQAGDGFDVIVAAGLLGRSRDPAEVLASVREALRPGGVAIFAVANISHWYPRTRFAFGRFGYERHGPLAASNLRFFTRGSLATLLDEAGLRARRWEARSRSTRLDAVGLAVSPGLFATTWLVETER